MSLGFTYHDYDHVDHYQKISLSINHMKVCRYRNSLCKNRGTSRYACQRASFTVEAAVVLPFFVCFMVFVLYFFRVLQVQAGVAQSLQYTSRRIAAECSIQVQGSKENDGQDGDDKVDGLAKTGRYEYQIEEKSNGQDGDSKSNGQDSDSKSDGQDGDSPGFVDLLKARVFFQQQLKKQYCPLQYITGGLAGISLARSDFSGNYIDLKAVYRMKLPVGLLGNIQYQIVQESKSRKWTGYQLGQDSEEDDTWLYYTEYGTVYHTSRSCTHLDLSIRGTPYGQVSQDRNNSGGKYHKCEKCGSGVLENGMVYITDYGNRYHSSLTCSGLKRSIYMIRRSKATDKKMCSKCGG